MGELLDKIEKPNDIKEMEKDELRPLAKEIRQFLVHKISHTGGHLASNLGVVELTMALHLFRKTKLSGMWGISPIPTRF